MPGSGGKSNAGISPCSVGPSLWPLMMDMGRGAPPVEQEPGQGKAPGEGPWARAGDVGGAGQKGGKVSLTCTHSYCVPRAVPTIVAVEAPVGVTGGSLCAVVPELLGTYLTALTAVGDEADPQRAAGWGWRALARPLAELGD